MFPAPFIYLSFYLYLSVYLCIYLSRLLLPNYPYLPISSVYLSNYLTSLCKYLTNNHYYFQKLLKFWTANTPLHPLPFLLSAFTSDIPPPHPSFPCPISGPQNKALWTNIKIKGKNVFSWWWLKFPCFNHLIILNLATSIILMRQYSSSSHIFSFQT